jgi:hypothetical protein
MPLGESGHLLQMFTSLQSRVIFRRNEELFPIRENHRAEEAINVANRFTFLIYICNIKARTFLTSSLKIKTTQ